MRSQVWISVVILLFCVLLIEVKVSSATFWVLSTTGPCSGSIIPVNGSSVNCTSRCTASPNDTTPSCLYSSAANVSSSGSHVNCTCTAVKGTVVYPIKTAGSQLEVYASVNEKYLAVYNNKCSAAYLAKVKELKDLLYAIIIGVFDDCCELRYWKIEIWIGMDENIVVKITVILFKIYAAIPCISDLSHTDAVKNATLQARTSGSAGAFSNVNITSVAHTVVPTATPKTTNCSVQVSTTTSTAGSVQLSTTTATAGSGQVSTTTATVGGVEVATTTATAGGVEVATTTAAGGEVATTTATAGGGEVTTTTATAGSGEVTTTTATAGGVEIATTTATVGGVEAATTTATANSGQVSTTTATVGGVEAATTTATATAGDGEQGTTATIAGQVQPTATTLTSGGSTPASAGQVQQTATTLTSGGSTPASGGQVQPTATTLTSGGSTPVPGGETTTGPNPTTEVKVAHANVTVAFTMNGTFIEAYNDPNSSVYKSLANKLEGAMCRVIRTSLADNAVIVCRVVRFSNGSIVAVMLVIVDQNLADIPYNTSFDSIVKDAILQANSSGTLDGLSLYSVDVTAVVPTRPSAVVPPPAPEDDDDGLEGWEIALIVIFVLILIGVVVFIVFLVVYKKKTEPAKEMEDRASNEHMGATNPTIYDNADDRV